MAERSGTRQDLVLTSGIKPRLRKRTQRDWTRKKEEAFLAALAETCNVTQSAKAAGVSLPGVYRRRRVNAAFRAGWAEAIANAYQRLELMMLERALNGTEKIIIRKDGSEERVRDYPNQVAMNLLKMHRDTAAQAIEAPAAADIEGMRERLFDKLQRMRKRIEGGKRS